MYLLPIFLAILVGLLPVAALLPAGDWVRGSAQRAFGPLPASPALLLLWMSLSFPLGSSVIGLANFVLLLTGVDSPWVVCAAATCLSALAWWILSRGQKGQIAPESLLAQGDASPVFSLNWLLGILAALCMLAVLASMAEMLAKSPYGAWDSWAIWSLRGKFFAGGEQFWRNAVDPGFRLSHPEYPVMFSSYLGWSWRVAGTGNVAVPQAAAYAFLLSLIGIVAAGLALLRRASLGLMAIPVLLSPVVMVTVPASLYADLPIGTLSTAAALVLLLGISSEVNARCFALAGVFASLSVWMKEEGQLHLAVAGAVALGFAWLGRGSCPRWWRPVAAFAASAAPASLFYAWFRFIFTPDGTRFSGRQGTSTASGGLIDRLLDISRYGEIADQVWRLFLTLGGWISHPFVLLALVLFLLGMPRQRLKSSVFLAASASLALLWAGYLVSFLLLGDRPGSILSASLHRLWVHTWPLLVVAVFLVARSPEDLAISVPAKLSRNERKQAKSAQGRARKAESRKGEA